MAVPPSALKHLVKLPVAAELKQLGVKLGVRIHTLNEIQAFNHENSLNFARGCLRDILYWWLNDGHDTICDRLEHGLRVIGETRLALNNSIQWQNNLTSPSGEQTHILWFPVHNVSITGL